MTLFLLFWCLEFLKGSFRTNVSETNRIRRGASRSERHKTPNGVFTSPSGGDLRFCLSRLSMKSKQHLPVTHFLTLYLKDAASFTFSLFVVLNQEKCCLPGCFKYRSLPVFPHFLSFHPAEPPRLRGRIRRTMMTPRMGGKTLSSSLKGQWVCGEAAQTLG